MKKGFTLLELLVVVLIIAILAAVALPQYEKSVDRALAVQALADINMFEKALEMLYLSNGGVVKMSDADFKSVMSVHCPPSPKGYICNHEFGNGVILSWNTMSITDSYRIIGYFNTGSSAYDYIELHRSDTGWYKMATCSSGVGKALCAMLADRPGWETH